MYKLKELKKTENINKIIIDILEYAHTCYMSYRVFDSIGPRYGNEYNMGFIFTISKSDEKIYNLKFRLLDTVTKNTNEKKCYYCNNHKGDLLFKCCNKPFNMSCGLMNGFLCECSINRNILKKTNNKIECCVCLEDTEDITKCGHPLCIECLQKIRDFSEIYNCPICREGLTILDICKYNTTLKIKKDNIKCNILYYE